MLMCRLVVETWVLAVGTVDIAMGNHS